jgi:8-oxo-dGTP pyrophosphatase MutT (NUDIX family)
VIIEPRSVQQVATLPFVNMDAAISVLLISSRRRQRWIVPKGWPVKRLSMPEAAANEAAEEAGVVGLVHDEPIGSYLYRKLMDAGYEVPCHVFVYPMLVLQHTLDWPERSERMMKWCSLEEAASLADDTQLGALLAELAETGGAPLHSIVTRAMSVPAVSQPA